MIRCAALALCVPTAIAFIASLSLAQPAGPRDADVPAAIDDSPAGSGVMSANVNLAFVQPISRQELESYADLLVLSDAQYELLLELYAKYQDADDAMRRAELPRLNAWASELAGA